MPNGQALCRRQARSQRGPFSSPLWGCVSPRRDTLLRRREHRGGRRGRIFRRLSDVSANRGAPLPCQRGGHRRGARAPPQIAFKTAYQIGHRGCSTVTRLRVPSSATRPGGRVGQSCFLGAAQVAIAKATHKVGQRDLADADGGRDPVAGSEGRGFETVAQPCSHGAFGRQGCMPRACSAFVTAFHSPRFRRIPSSGPRQDPAAVIWSSEYWIVSKVRSRRP